ncbi:site-specific integrase [Halomonas vilamensis]|uniref:Site-specific integrase n=1 Tax=Vreelandella vilamensis TaxID=531309 RepID=A0ABU1H3F7_9GAMM|nr:site-specific integrase [Halomonas vilamensis]MDR5898835.1 site-specific integrase [Halomonas vilamensis]
MSLILWEIPDFFIDQEFQTENNRCGKKVAIIPGTGRSVGRMPLLYRENGIGITVANNWLIHLKANLHKKEVNTQAQGLLHYFTFLDNINYAWDFMPAAIRQRPTYAFKKHLREAFKNRTIARSTANSYMSVVIRFYKFYLARNHHFENPPFNYEFVRVELPGRHDFMKNKILHVDSTDLRLNLPKDYRFNGLARKLVPLSTNEWSLLDDFLKSDRKGIVRKSIGSNSVSLSIEFKLAIYIGRFSGLRRGEIITLRAKQIYLPDKDQLSKKYLIHTEGLLLDPKLGVSTKNESIRHAEIPSELMNELHKYVNSPRYIERKRKFILNHPDEADNPPLLINQRGKFFSSKTLDARWGEIKNAFSNNKIDFDHKFHNLRSSYAVFRLKELLDSGLNEAEALDYLQAVMGQKHRSTLLAYLKFSKQEKSANQVYEEAIEIILKG